MKTLTLSKLVKLRCALKTLQIMVEEIIDEECKIEHKKDDEPNKKMVA